MFDLAANLETALQTSLLLAVVVSFLGGLLASLTPCVYPLIPIVVTFVGTKTLGEKTRLKAFILSLAYVLGMALVYSLLGMVAALSGKMFGQIGTSFWAQFIVANIMIVLGLGMLDVFPLPLYSSQSPGAKDKKGLAGAFMLGMASGLVASPCTAPILGVILTYVASTQNVFQGGSLLFSFSLGMGGILLLAGTFSGFLASLPKPGQWMLYIKKGLGLAMIVLGEYFLLRAGQVWY
ncbi:MAG: cytochrome c biogenesis protein CcdA [Desulfohalobiaceae bacterium]